MLLLCFPAVIAVTGCTGPRRDVAWPERRSLGREIQTYKAPSDSPGASSPTIVEPGGELMLRDALSLALMHSPELAAVAWEARAAEARTLQAGLWPNPELEVEIEELRWSDGADASSTRTTLGSNGSFEIERETESGPGSGFSNAEYTIIMSQLIELDGKRGKRVRAARLEQDLAGWDYETERLAVLTDATLGFIDVLAAQGRLQLAQEIVCLSEKTLATVAQLVNVGKVSPLEKTKAAVELANNKIELDKAGSELRFARKRLASTWGSMAPRFSKAVGAMDRVSEIPVFETVQALLRQNPNVARWAQEMEQRLATLALERARRVPDLTVGLGVQRFEETNDYALTFGLSLPLPLFDRNQGGVLEAHYRLAQLRHERKSAEVRTSTALAESYETLVSARNEAIGLRDEVVPGAAKAFDAAQEGYQQGKFGYLEVLDAQRTLFEARSRFLNALAQYHRSVAIVESLIGTKLDSLQNQKGKER